MKKNYHYRKKSEASGELSLLELQPSSKHDGKHGGKHAKQNYMMVMKGLRHFVANVYQKNNSLLFSDNLCLRTGNKREQLRYPSIKWTLTKQSLAIQRHCMFCSIAWINRHLNERQIFSVVDRPGKLLVYASEKNSAALENQKNVGLAPLTMNLKNNSSKWPMAVQNVTVSDEFKKFIKVKKFTKKTLLAGEVLEVEFYVNKNLLAYGAYDAPLTVSYKSSTEPEIQEIQMPLRFMVVTPRNMKPKKIIPTEEEDFDEKRRVEIPGIKYLKVMSEKSVKERRVRNHLFDYPLPKPIRELYKIVKEQKGKEPIIPSDLQKELRKFENVLSAPLTASNYVEKFEAVLNLEEFHEEREIAKFNMWNVPLYNNQSSMRFRLIVGDGLAEGRPSLMQGDQVFIILSQEAVDNQRKPGSFNNRAAQGFTNRSGKKRGNGFYGTIKNVGRREVIIKCEDLVNGKRHHPNNKYHIQFSLNRYSYRLCYRALSLINNNILSILMPQGEYKKSFEKRTLEFFNKDIASNPEQVQAITNIVSRSCTPFPYIVFGPPGTGKTKTLVEAILQNWVVGKNQLVCASSNSAADVIVEEILKMAASNNDYLSNFEPDKNLLRLYSMSVEIASVSENILRHPIHNFEETNEAAYPPIADVLRIPIVVGTLATAARLSLQGIPANHFSHVFVDECGHCTEPECVLAVAGIIGKGGRSRAGDSTGVLETQLVLAGDPQQLGSTVQCKLSTMYQFGYSMLERLLKTTDMYQRDPRTGKYNPEVVTKLSRNYRSHRDIIDISNQLFYNGELVASGKPETLNSCSKIDFLPQKDHPVIFHGITGVEEQDDSSPSYFNMNEIDQVVAYISMLIDEANAKGLKYTLNDIGVVTPYKRQVKKLAQTFEDREWNEVAVGSVDLFQGSEKQIILISTVRASRTGKNASGKTAFGQQLDFINDAKRFNVALTRAKALLIVIGDPEILQFQSYWKLYMDYCLNKGTYMGALPASYKKVNELVKVKPNPIPKKSKTPKEKTPKKEKIGKSGMKTCGSPENGGGGDCVGVKSLEKSGGGDGPKRKSKVGKSESGGKGVEKTFRDLIMSVDIEEEIEELDRSMVTMKIKEERNEGGREDDEEDVEDLEKSMERMTTKEEGKEEDEEEEDALRKYFEKRMTIKEEGKEEEEEEVLRKYFEKRMTIKEEGEEENGNELKMKKEGKKEIKEEKVGNETTRNENENIEESDDEEDDKIILKKEKQKNVKKENEKMLRSPLKEKEKLCNNNSESFKDKNSDVTEFEYNENWKSLKEVEMEKILRSISNLD